MAKFISITNKISDLEDKDRFTTVAVYAYLKDFITSNSREVKRYHTAISNDLNMSISSVKRAAVSLKQCGLVLDVVKSETDANGNKLVHKCNVYKFDNDMKGSYFMISSDFINDTNISAKIKGFLLILRSFCKNGSNSVDFKSKRNLMKMLRIGNMQTLDKYLDEVKYTDYIKIIGTSVVFSREYFYLYNPNSFLTDEQKLYTYIWDYCFNNGVVPPMKHLNGGECDKTLFLMATVLKGQEVDLMKKVPSLPEVVTLEYFYKALCNETRKINNNKQTYEFIL